VILASSTTNLTVIQQATSTVPVLFIQVSDPVAQGFVANVTRPGGNLTGFSMFEFAIGNRWLDLLKEIAPGLAHVDVMFNPDTSPQSRFFMQSIEVAAPSLGVQASVIPVRATADVEPAFERLAGAPTGGLILPTGFTNLRIELIAGAARHRHRLCAATARTRLDRGSHHRDRVSLGGGTPRAAPEFAAELVRLDRRSGGTQVTDGRHFRRLPRTSPTSSSPIPALPQE
jgi:hypothetical protein